MPKVNSNRLLIFTIISSIGYLLLGYFTSRDQTFNLFSVYFSLFVAYIAVCYYTPDTEIKRFIYVAIGIRLLLLLSTPSLSDDIYRFIWDGRLILNGISPFAALPIDYTSPDAVSIPGINTNLFQLLNSPEYFTVYPPLSQFVFWLSVLISPNNIIGSIVIIRSLILAAEAGSIVLISRLLKHYQLPQKNILLYALNPLVIIELTGNLHFEAFVIFFMLFAIFFVTKNRIFFSGISWSFAIGFKLIPLIFLPLVIRRLSIKTQVILYSTVGISTLLLFIPLYDQALITGLQSSLTLYFQKFEFNASIYYIARTIGYWIKGYNIIGQLGPALAVITFGSIMIYSLLNKTRTAILPVAMMWSILIYLSFATTVHPWYITTLVALSVFSNYRFPVLWSVLIFLTYTGYSMDGYVEPTILVTIEYLAVAGLLIFELYKNRLSSTNSPN